MVNDLYTPDKTHVLKAIKMAAWRNADAKLEAADVQKMDRYIDGNLDPPISVVTPSGKGSFLPNYLESGYMPGVWTEMLYFQTAMQLYPSMGICTTADDTPSASLYTHTFGIRTAQTPTNQGRHWERENTTDAESERIDILGMLCRTHHIECSETQPVGVQLLNWGCAFTLNAATDDITAAQADDIPFKWTHFTFPTFTYNSETIEAYITGWSFDVQNTVMFFNPDSTGYHQVGRYVPQTTLSTTLEIIPYGKNAFELVRTKLGGYLTDLDLTVKCARSATDYVQWVHDKCYCFPFTLRAVKDPGTVERYFLRMVQLDTGSLVPTAVDDYDDDYYET